MAGLLCESVEVHMFVPAYSFLEVWQPKHELYHHLDWSFNMLLRNPVKVLHVFYHAVGNALRVLGQNLAQTITLL